MKKVGLLDCTLRDGGYVNDWNFGHSVITGTYKRLNNAGVEYIEVGFLDDRQSFDINRTIAPSTQCYNDIFKDVKKKKSIPVAMIDFGTCGLENIDDCDKTFIDGIRVIFKKEKIKQALPFCREIKEKGYKLFIQAISITSYSELEILEYVQKINEIHPYAFSIVDTYGLLDDRKLKYYFYMIDNNLDSDIKIGCHAHNNFQLAFSNTMKFLDMDTKRPIIADSTVYGMGKSAGNCPSELIAMYMNQNYEKCYDINQFLEILDTDLMSIFQTHYWGYKYNFYISAMQNCHPGYVQYLLDKKTLTVSSINEILSGIPCEKKLMYDESYIRDAYTKYQSVIIDESDTIQNLSAALNGKDVLLLGPGRSILDDAEIISDFIERSSCMIISVNFIPQNYPYNYVFVSNAKRFGKLIDIVGNHEFDKKMIITSNITPYGCTPKYKLNYETLFNANNVKSDNAVILCLSMLINAGVKNATLAGFDGFMAKDTDYYDISYSFTGNSEYLIKMNEEVKKGLDFLSKRININFLTKSYYRESVE